MKKIRKWVGLLALIMCLGISFGELYEGGAVQVSAASYIKKTVLKGYSVTLNFSKKVVSCKSAKSSIAKVKRISSKKIKITGVKKGTAEVTVKLKGGSKKYYKIKVESPKISSGSMTLYTGESARLKVSGTTQKIKWKSSDTSVVTIGESGMLTARDPGMAKITATVAGKKKLTCMITVEKVEEFTALDEVKMLIERYGNTDSYGDPYIEKKEDEYIYRITYDRSAETLEYSFLSQQKTLPARVYMTTKDPGENPEASVLIDVDMHVNTKVDGESVAEVFSYQYSCKFNQDEYYREYKPLLETKVAPSMVNDDFIKDYAHTCLRLAFLNWTDLLQEYTGYRINKIGFARYEY